MNSEQSNSRLVTPAEYEALMKKSAGYAARQRHFKQGPKYIKIGRQVRYYENDIKAWLEERRYEPTTSACERPRAQEAA